MSNFPQIFFGYIFFFITISLLFFWFYYLRNQTSHTILRWTPSIEKLYPIPQSETHLIFWTKDDKKLSYSGDDQLHASSSKMDMSLFYRFPEKLHKLITFYYVSFLIHGSLVESLLPLKKIRYVQYYWLFPTVSNLPEAALRNISAIAFFIKSLLLSLLQQDFFPSFEFLSFFGAGEKTEARLYNYDL